MDNVGDEILRQVLAHAKDQQRQYPSPICPHCGGRGELMITHSRGGDDWREYWQEIVTCNSCKGTGLGSFTED